jgi:putative FmdB family regulatory protein
MPTYEYACTECHHEWEEIQKISELPVEVCPACKKVSAQRLISGGNFILKGGGWYADLYSSPKPKGGSGTSDAKGSGESKPEKGDGGTKAETKSSETKTDTKPTSSSTTTEAA